MIEVLVGVGIGGGLLVAGAVFFYNHVQRLHAVLEVLLASEDDVTKLPVGSRIKVTGVVDTHPDHGVLPTQLARGDSRRHLYRDWSVEEATKWKQIGDGIAGVPALITVDGHQLGVELQNTGNLVVLSDLEPPVFLDPDDQKPLHSFLRQEGVLDVSFDEWSRLTRRVRYTVIEPGDEITVVGKTRHTENSRDPARLSIGGDTESVFVGSSLIVTDWSPKDLLSAGVRSVLGTVFSMYLMVVGSLVAGQEFVTVPFSEITTELLLVAIVGFVAFVYLQSLYYRVVGE